MRGPRKRQLAGLNAALEHALAAGVELGGKRWHCDRDFQQQITALVVAFDTGILAAGTRVPIRAKDNTITQMGAAQIKALAGAVLERVQQIYAAYWAAKDTLQ